MAELAWPADLGHGTFVGRFGFMDADNHDPDREPNITSATGGTVTITPSARSVRYSGAQGPMILAARPAKGVIDSEGYLCTAKADGSAGDRGMVFPATDDTDLTPTNWTYEVSIILDGQVRIPAFHVKLPTGATVDLSLAAPVPSSGGTAVVVDPKTAERAEAAAAQAEATVAGIDRAITEYVAANPDLQGDPGPPGASVVGGVDQGDGTIRFVLSDGSQTDPVTLPPGPAGRGIDSISDPSPEGMVTVTYTDGVTQDVRAIRGQDGRGIASISDPDAESRVTVTYTDGTTQQVQAIRGRDGRAPVIEWAGTALVVDGVAGPDLRGAPGAASTVPGPAGPPGAVPVASDYLVVGPGRPDAPTTTGMTSAALAALPVGCEYRSTDGASVGAWVWRKRPTGWVVTQGDTGWVTLTDPDIWAEGGMMFRRVDSSLYWKVGTGAYGLFRWSAAFPNGTLKASVIPAPFRPQGTSAYITLRTDAPSKAVVGAFEIQTTGHVVRRTTDNGTLTSDTLSGPTSNAWPTTLTP